MPRPVEIVAHRGNGFGARANTLAGVREVVACGQTGLEVDVHLTADGAVVVHHDHYLEHAFTRRADTHAPAAETAAIERLDLATLRAHEIVETTDAAGTPRTWAPVPLLSEALAMWKQAQPGRRMFVELKTSPEYEETRTDPEALAGAVVNLIEEHGMTVQTVLLAFDWRGLEHARSLNPVIARYHLTFPMLEALPPLPARVRDMLNRTRRDKSLWAGSHDPDKLGCTIAAAVAQAGGAGWSAYHEDWTEVAVAEAHARGLGVSAWTVNDAQQMARLIEMGVDTIVTDAIDTALRFAARA
ncbi:MAG: glycerophosphodiester phosphodiesterase family protein [Parvularculaceae bacterium]